MEETLKQLQKLQMKALQKNIDYDLSVSEKDIKVEMYYTSISDNVMDNRNFSATFSSDDSLADMKLECVKKFINDISK